MKRWIYIAGWAALLVAPGCQRAPLADPRFLSESAKADFDRASLVLLANVETVSDAAPRVGPTGIRPIVITLRVHRVLKGELSAHVVCATYFFPYGGFEGQLPAWVERGSTGIFTLEKGDGCLRAVNDSRAIMNVYKEPLGAPVSLDQFVAEATLPYSCPDIYKAASNIHSITIPLVGSRAAWKLFNDLFADGDSGVKVCSCLAAGLAWRLRDSCFDSLPAASEAQQDQAESIKTTNDRLYPEEEQQLRENPLAWLRPIMEGWGMDGALLRISELTRPPASPLPAGTCNALKAGRASSLFAESLAKGRLQSTNAAEDAAVRQFGKWLDSGCHGDWQHLENPLINP